MKNCKRIFIGGTGRSGTSVFNKLLLGQKDIFGLDKKEGKFLISPRGLLDLYVNCSASYSPARASMAVNDFRNLMTRTVCTSKVYGYPYKFDELLGGGRYFEYLESFLSNFKNDTESVALYLKEDYFFSIAGQYVDDLFSSAARESEKHHWVEKTPHNILQVDFLWKLIPDAVIINIQRDPRAVVKSILNIGWVSSLSEGCQYYKQVFSKFRTQSDILNSKANFYSLVRLEDIALEREMVKIALERVLGDISIDFDIIDWKKDSIEGWKRGFTQSEFRFVSDELEEEIAFFGYDPS